MSDEAATRVDVRPLDVLVGKLTAVPTSPLDTVVGRVEVDAAVLGPRDELVGWGVVVAARVPDAVLNCVDVESVALCCDALVEDRVEVDVVVLDLRDALVGWRVVAEDGSLGAVPDCVAADIVLLHA